MPHTVVARGTVNDRYSAPPNVILWLSPEEDEGGTEHVAYFVPMQGEGSDSELGTRVLASEIGTTVTVAYTPMPGMRRLNKIG